MNALWLSATSQQYMCVQQPIWRSQGSFQDDIEDIRHSQTLMSSLLLTAPFSLLLPLMVCRHCNKDKLTTTIQIYVRLSISAD